MQWINFLWGRLQSILQHQRDSLINTIGYLLRPKIVFSIMVQGFSNHHYWFNMAIFHRLVLLPCHKSCLNWSLPDSLRVFGYCTLNNFKVVFQKLSFVNMSCSEIVKIESVVDRIKSKVRRIGVALHNSHLKKLLKSQFHDSSPNLISELLRISSLL